MTDAPPVLPAAAATTNTAAAGVPSQSVSQSAGRPRRAPGASQWGGCPLPQRRSRPPPSPHRDSQCARRRADPPQLGGHGSPPGAAGLCSRIPGTPAGEPLTCERPPAAAPSHEERHEGPAAPPRSFSRPPPLALPLAGSARGDRVPPALPRLSALLGSF